MADVPAGAAEVRLPIVLTQQELVELSGYTRPHEQIAWLKANRFVYLLGRADTPRVDRTHYLMRMGGHAEARRPHAEPDWAALKAASPKAK